MRNLLIYIHGKKADCQTYNVFIKKMAKKYDAEVFSFNAPMKYKEGFSWFNKAENFAIISLNDLLDNLIYTINKKLEEEKLSWDNVILCGYSQGGFLATYLGIMFNAQKVISICGDLPYNLDYKNKDFSREIPIYWIESRQDNCLSDERKESYKLLVKEDYNVKYIVSDKLTHSILDEKILKDDESVLKSIE